MKNHKTDPLDITFLETFVEILENVVAFKIKCCNFYFTKSPPFSSCQREEAAMYFVELSSFNYLSLKSKSVQSVTKLENSNCISILSDASKM